MCVISELCYNGTIFQTIIGIIWSFSYNSLVKFHGKKMGFLVGICVRDIVRSK